MQSYVTKALAAMGWGGKGKGAAWSPPWTPPQWTPTAEGTAPASAPSTFVPQEEGPGATRFAYSLLYKEREKMAQVLEEQRKKDEKQEREQEFQKLRQELLAGNKQPSIEESIYRTMIADNPEKKPQAESQEQENKGMFGTMLKMMRAMTGSKDSKDHTPSTKAKKKRQRSSSSSISVSSEKPKKKKHRSSKAATPKDKKRSPTNKARRHSSRKTAAASSDNPEEEESDEVGATPLPLKIPKRAAASSASPPTSQSNRKARSRQFDANVQSMVKTYCKSGDEIDIPKLDDQEAIDTFTEEMCAIMKKYKVTVLEINQVLASNKIPLAKEGKNMTKQQKIEAILMHNVEPDKKNKPNEGSDD